MEPCPTLNVSAHLFPIVLQIHVASNQNVLTGSHRHHPQRGHNQRVPTLTLTNYKSTKRTIHFLDKMTKHYSNAGKNNTIYVGIYITYIDSIDPMHPHFWLKLCQELITWPCLHQTSGGSHSWTGHGSLLSWWQRCASTSSVQQVINAGGMMVSASTCLHPHLYCLCMSEPQLIPIMNIYIYNRQ